jgi:SEC-C motif domain protein
MSHSPLSSRQCPCGNQDDFANCCQPLIRGDQVAKTAEQLMRSRYSAHAVARDEAGAIDYLMQTWAPEQRAHIDRQAVSDWATTAQWLGLTIVSHQPQGNTATVEFIARYSHEDQIQLHRELSHFCRKNDRWYFIDGEEPQRKEEPQTKEKPIAVGRNTPCPCGSGKKYKRCCAD